MAYAGPTFPFPHKPFCCVPNVSGAINNVAPYADGIWVCGQLMHEQYGKKACARKQPGSCKRLFGTTRPACAGPEWVDEILRHTHPNRFFYALPMKKIGYFFVAAWLVFPSAGSAQDAPQLQLPRVRLALGMYQIDAQVAQTPEQRAVGLMFRREMPQHEGMLFVFEQPSTLCFWMKNTYLPLTAAFISDDGKIVNLADMKPQTTNSHCANQPVRYVLEMNQGWFAKRGITPGRQLSGIPFESRK